MYLLDTNTASYLCKKNHPLHEKVRARTILYPAPEVCITAITEAELRFGLEWKPVAKAVRATVLAFLATVRILPFDSNAAAAYATLRTKLNAKGINLGAFDLLIAAQAYALNATLVSHDEGFARIKANLHVEDWTQA
jgi:tRNA(fMet)-specific endonuclease VapC